METIINLTPVQRKTLDSLNKGSYDDIKMSNITRLLKKILTNTSLANEVLPKVVDYEMKTKNKPKPIDVEKDLLKRISGKLEKETIKNYFQTDNREELIAEEQKEGKPQFDTKQDLDDLLDSLTGKQHTIKETLPSQGSKLKPMASRGIDYSQSGFMPVPVLPQGPQKQPAPMPSGGFYPRKPKKPIVPVPDKPKKQPAPIPSGDFYPRKPKKPIPPMPDKPAKQPVPIPDKPAKQPVPIPDKPTKQDFDDVIPFKPYSGKSYRLTDEDIKSKQPATMDEFMKRNGREGKSPEKEDFEAYDKYIENAKKGVENAQTNWTRIQDDIAKNRQRVRDGEIPLGDKFDNTNDPFGIMRGLGYEYESDLGEESAGILTGSFFRTTADVVKSIPIAGEVLGDILDVFGDISEKAVNWLEHVRAKRNYDYGKFDLDEYNTSGFMTQDENGEWVLNKGNRTDDYYRQNWKYNETYLPTDYDPFGRIDPYNKGKQAKYLKPLDEYDRILKNATPEFIDSVSPEQKRFLDQLHSTLIKIRLNELNITHKQYRDLLKASIDLFTPEQRQTDALQKVEESAVKTVEDIYLSGQGKDNTTLEGDIADFAEKIVDDIKTATSTKDKDPTYDPKETETEEEKKEEEEDDKPDEEEEEEEEEEEKEEEPEEEPVIPSGIKESTFATDFGAEPKFRPRGQWGGTDELFEVTEDDKAKRDLVIEASTLNEGIDRTNPFFKRQQVEYDMRYKNTFPMPPVDNYTPVISKQWMTENRPIWISQKVPTMRPIENTMRDAYQWGQYSQFQPKYDYDVARGVAMSNTNNFPSVADSLTLGEPMPVDVITNYKQMIMNQRWTK